MHRIRPFRLSTVALSLLLYPAVSSWAGGFDNTGRPFGIIFDGEGQPNEFRLTYSHISPDVHGDVVRSQSIAGEPPQIAEELVSEYDNLMLGFRYQLNDQVSCAGRYEEPFRAQVHYQDDSLSYVPDSSAPAVQRSAPIDSVYQSRSWSFACRYGWQTEHQRFYLFGGPKLQKIKGFFSTDLSALDVGSTDNLDVALNGGREIGYLAGLAWELPAIAASVSLIYHSEISYQLKGLSKTPIPNQAERAVRKARASTDTPQSYHLNLQTGVAPDWLVFGELKWSEWSKVNRIAVTDGLGNPSLGLFKNDTLDFSLGVIHATSERLRLGASYSSSKKLGSSDYPPGADSDNLRDPQGKRHTFLIGGKYWCDEHFALDAKLAYTKLEDKRIDDGAYILEINDANALTVEVGVSRFF